MSVQRFFAHLFQILLARTMPLENFFGRDFSSKSFCPKIFLEIFLVDNSVGVVFW